MAKDQRDMMVFLSKRHHRLLSKAAKRLDKPVDEVLADQLEFLFTNAGEIHASLQSHALVTELLEEVSKS